MKIKLETVEKASVSSVSEYYEMESLEQGLIERGQSKPGFLSALLGGEAVDSYIATTTVSMEDLQETLQLPGGKRFDEYGPVVKEDKARRLSFVGGSFGITATVNAGDWANKKMPGSQEMMNEDYVIAKQLTKLDTSWDLFHELAFAQIINSDTNITRGSAAIPSYNFHQEIYGTARAAAIAMDVANPAINPFTKFSEVLDQMHEEVDKANSSMTKPLVLCGKNYFNARLARELQAGLARPLMGELDLASMEIPRENFGAGNGKFAVQNFESHDGGHYVKIGQSILGTKLIPDDSAFIVPVGATNFLRRVFMPAQDRDFANTVAVQKYGWTKSDRRSVRVAQESNVLYANINPKMIVPLTVGP